MIDLPPTARAGADYGEGGVARNTGVVAADPSLVLIDEPLPHVRRITLNKVAYQPERAGRYDL
mgnify:CR=1 FL=1